MALHFLHLKGISHKNVSIFSILCQNNLRELDREKEHNILLSQVFDAYGFKKRVIDRQQISSIYFMAPERLSGKIKEDAAGSNLSDLWSVGVLLYLLISGKLPFEGLSNEELYSQIYSGDYYFYDREWEHF